MAKRLYTAADIQRLVYDDHETTLVVAKGDIVTPLALDAAHELGVEITYEGAGSADLPVWSGAAQQITSAPTAKPAALAADKVDRGGASPGDDLEAQVRAIVTAMVAGCHPQKPVTPVRHVEGRHIRLEPFPFDVKRPEMDIRLVDVVTSEHGSPMAAGVMSFREGSFPWTLNYAEIDLVLEGELHIETTEGTLVGKPGDVLYIPEGTSISFATPSWTKFFYVTYPADWSDA
jgi:ethanolamine utilization protein EutQ